MAWFRLLSELKKGEGPNILWELLYCLIFIFQYFLVLLVSVSDS